MIHKVTIASHKERIEVLTKGRGEVRKGPSEKFYKWLKNGETYTCTDMQHFEDASICKMLQNLWGYQKKVWMTTIVNFVWENSIILTMFPILMKKWACFEHMLKIIDLGNNNPEEDKMTSIQKISKYLITMIWPVTNSRMLNSF